MQCAEFLESNRTAALIKCNSLPSCTTVVGQSVIAVLCWEGLAYLTPAQCRSTSLLFWVTSRQTYLTAGQSVVNRHCIVKLEWGNSHEKLPWRSQE